jgi:uncharacterized HAD superfamily protein
MEHYISTNSPMRERKDVCVDISGTACAKDIELACVPNRAPI